MKILASIGVFFFALSFCNLAERFTGKKDANSTQQPSVTNSKNSNSPTISTDEDVEKAELTAEQTAALANGQETKWDEQAMAWTLPKGWKKMSQTKNSFNYSSPDLAFLLVNISPMPDTFPVDVSVKAFYQSSVQRQKSGEIETVRYLEIDSVKGIEFTETMPENKGDARRHQWISYRKYNDQVQMLNVMLSTKGSNFEKHRNEFPAILYSMKVEK